VNAGAGWVVQVDEPAEDSIATVPGLPRFDRACRAADRHAPFEEHTLLTLQGHRQVPHARFTVVERQRLLGCAVLNQGLDAWYAELATHPDHRRRGVAGALLAAVRGHVRSHGGGPLRHWVHELLPAVRALSPHARTQRSLLVMRRALDDTLPDNTAGTRWLDPDADRDAWLRLTNAAFVGHPENGGWTRADLDWRLDAAWTDPSCWPVVADGDALVAGVWTKVEPGSPDGELYVVAVAPHAQGRGLGKRVVAAALQGLSRRGCSTALLYVDAENAPAVALYTWAGFTTSKAHRCLEETVLGPQPARTERGQPAASVPPR